MSDQQQITAIETVRELNEAGIFPAQIVTEITKFDTFYEAEENHQDYLQKYPDGYTCHFIRANWSLKN